MGGSWHVLQDSQDVTGAPRALPVERRDALTLIAPYAPNAAPM
jgi:hypothetical protein